MGSSITTDMRTRRQRLMLFGVLSVFLLGAATFTHRKQQEQEQSNQRQLEGPLNTTTMKAAANNFTHRLRNTATREQWLVFPQFNISQLFFLGNPMVLLHGGDKDENDKENNKQQSQADKDTAGNSTEGSTEKGEEEVDLDADAQTAEISTLSNGASWPADTRTDQTKPQLPQTPENNQEENLMQQSSTYRPRKHKTKVKGKFGYALSSSKIREQRGLNKKQHKQNTRRTHVAPNYNFNSKGKSGYYYKGKSGNVFDNSNNGCAQGWGFHCDQEHGYREPVIYVPPGANPTPSTPSTPTSTPQPTPQPVFIPVLPQPTNAPFNSPPSPNPPTQPPSSPRPTPLPTPNPTPIPTPQPTFNPTNPGATPRPTPEPTTPQPTPEPTPQPTPSPVTPSSEGTLCNNLGDCPDQDNPPYICEQEIPCLNDLGFCLFLGNPRWTMIWEGDFDFDLHVIIPGSGVELNATNRDDPASGCSLTFVSDPVDEFGQWVENVVCPVDGSAPTGDYEFFATQKGVIGLNDVFAVITAYNESDSVIFGSRVNVTEGKSPSFFLPFPPVAP